MEGLSVQLEGVTSETTALLKKTNDLAEDIQQKSEKLNTVVDAVKGLGNSVTEINSSVHKVTQSVAVEAERNSDKVAQVIQWSQVAIGIMDKVNERKSKTKGWTAYKPVEIKRP